MRFLIFKKTMVFKITDDICTCFSGNSCMMDNCPSNTWPLNQTTLVGSRCLPFWMRSPPPPPREATSLLLSSLRVSPRLQPLPQCDPSIRISASYLRMFSPCASTWWALSPGRLLPPQTRPALSTRELSTVPSIAPPHFQRPVKLCYSPFRFHHPPLLFNCHRLCYNDPYYRHSALNESFLSLFLVQCMVFSFLKVKLLDSKDFTLCLISKHKPKS